MPQQVVFAPYRQGFYEQIAPSLISLVGSFGLQKMAQGFKAGQIQGEHIFQQKQAQAVQDWEEKKLQMELESKERIADIKDARAANLKFIELRSKGLVRPGFGEKQAGSPQEGSVVTERGAEWIFTPRSTLAEEKGRVFSQLSPEQQQSILLKQTGEKQYAPDMETWVNQKTGEDTVINVRNASEIELAKKAGFSPVSPEERGYGIAFGQESAKKEIAIGESAEKAREQMMTLDNMDQLLDRFETGKLSGVILNVQSYADALGLPIGVANLPYKQAFNAITNELALRSRNLGKGMVLAGQMSDKDVQFLKDMNPQLTISKGGNRLIIRMRRKLVERQNEAASLVYQYKEEHDGRFNYTDFVNYSKKKFTTTSLFGIPLGAVRTGPNDYDSITGLPTYKTPDGKIIIPDI